MIQVKDFNTPIIDSREFSLNKLIIFIRLNSSTNCFKETFI